MRICIPTETDAAMDAKVYGHFGSAPYFTIYDADNSNLDVIRNDNSHHSHGMCQPMGMIADKRIDMVVCLGMGARAVQILNTSGVKVYRADAPIVRGVVERLKQGDMEEITVEGACKDHGCH